jgi:hypothetical protein
MYNKLSSSLSNLHHLAWGLVLVLSLTACGGDGSSGTAAQTSGTTSAATTPPTSAATQPFILHGEPQTFVKAGALYQYTPASTGSNGRVLSYDIVNKPDWATFVETTGKLFGTPDEGNVGTTAQIEIGVSDGTTRATVGPFRITVTPENEEQIGSPAIAGTPTASVTAGQPYSFMPITSNPGGETLSFSIVNRPAWAAFNTATGALSGTPTSTSVGSYTGIVISVSGGGDPVSLPAFAIQVLSAVDGAPTISGTPATTVASGSNYAFKPTAADPNGNALTFSIANPPSWASFDKSTGELSGTPPASALASLSSNIVISVSDGTLSASLAPFAIAVTAVTTPTQTGACGPASGTPVAAAPTSGLCSTGTASAVTGSGPWAWSCAVDNAVTKATCSAPLLSSTSGTRNPLQQPFATSSIWNMPIGSDAAYAPANLTANPASADSGSTNVEWSVVFGLDPEYIILTPTAPLVQINYESNAWSGASRCDASGSGNGFPISVPIPASYTVPSDNNNDGAAILAPDGQTIIQFQPIALCTAGGSGTGSSMAPSVNLYGPGILGAHGGSGMSSIGGSIRVGELRPGQVGMHHALKVDMNYYEYYHASSQSQSYRWPAVTSDSGWQSYGLTSAGAQGANYSNPAMVMGALLAIPKTVNISSLNLQTEPAKQLAWTLQNYGAYIVDSSTDCCFNFSEEESPAGSVSAQFQSDWGFPMMVRFNAGSAWAQDIETIRTVLQVVNNNGPSSVGGGGTPLQPLAPQISAP